MFATERAKVKPVRLGSLNSSRTFEMLAPGGRPLGGTVRLTKGAPDGLWPAPFAKVTVLGVMLETLKTRGALIMAAELFVTVTMLLNVFVARFNTKPDFVVVTWVLMSTNDCA